MSGPDHPLEMLVHTDVDVAVKFASLAAGLPLPTNFVSPDGEPLAGPFEPSTYPGNVISI